MGAAAIARVMIDAEEQRRGAIRRFRIIKRVLRDVSDPFSMEPESFKRHYRLTPHLALRLIGVLRERIEGDRISAIPAHLQVLAVLRFLSDGTFQKGVANNFNHPCSQATMSRCIERVINAIADIADMFIRFSNTRAERERVKASFQRYNRIPGIIGLIDCFKVAFWRPTENEEAFFNHRTGTSMNVQVISDADYIIRSIRICPGSNTDHFIWQFSDVKAEMESLRGNENILQEEGHYYLLGDNGYTPSPVMLTPIINAIPGSPEAQYTAEHVSTRCKIEQCFGILTHVWFSISRARKLHYKPEKVAKIITACCMLHNFRRLNGIEDELHPFHDEEEVNVIPRDQDYYAGIAERNRLINTYYA